VPRAWAAQVIRTKKACQATRSTLHTIECSKPWQAFCAWKLPAAAAATSLHWVKPFVTARQLALQESDDAATTSSALRAHIPLGDPLICGHHKESAQ
jgi:hypothetical protein